MSELESKRAKPVLTGMIRDGSELCLLQSGIRSIVAFAFKGAVVADHINLAGRKPFFLPAVRQKFADTLEIPIGVHLWLGAYRSAYAASGFLRTSYGKARPGQASGLELYAFTYGVGFLVFQVLAVKWKRAHRDLLRGPVFSQADFWGRFARQVWPTSGTAAIWPPVEYMDEAVLEIFCNRWKGLRVLK